MIRMAKKRREQDDPDVITPEAVAAITAVLNQYGDHKDPGKRKQTTELTPPEAFGTGEISWNMTSADVRRMRMLAVLGMLQHGEPMLIIRQKLGLSKSVLEKVVRGLMTSGMAAERIDDLRNIEMARLEWALRNAAEGYEATHNPAFLTVYTNTSSLISKLYGLNKPVKVEVEHTRRVGVVFETFASREEVQSKVLSVQSTPLLEQENSDGQGDEAAAG